MTAEHWSSSSHILILSPQSVPIFDMYCHPEWLKPRPRYIYYKRRERDIAKGEVEAEFWTRKVILKHNWIEKCLSAGKFLVCASFIELDEVAYDRVQQIIGVDAESEG